MNFLLVPAWILASLQYLATLLALGAGALLAIAFLTARRGWEPRCGRCAHDLRRLDPTTGVCPECGAELSRMGAVRMGRRRVRPAVAIAGFALLGLAALCAWKLDAAGTRALRARLIASMPTQTLFDAIFEGGPQQQLAQDALVQKRVLVLNTQRVLPSGELLDLVLRAADRCDEPGRRPLAAVLQSDVRMILFQLDKAETDALVERAVEELIASGGIRTTRYQLAMAVEAQGRDNPSLWERIMERLDATPEGRRVTALRPTAEGPMHAGSVGRITLRQPLPPTQRRLATGLKDENQRTLVVGDATLESADGAVRRTLVAVPRQRMGIGNREDPNCELLIDAPPGAYRLTLTGAIAKSVLLPRAASPFDAPPAVTVAEALALDGSSGFEGTCELVVTAPAADVRTFTTDEDAVAQVARRLAECRVETQSGGATIALDSLAGLERMRNGGGDQRVVPMSLFFSARQRGRTWPLGSFTTLGNGYSAGIGPLPDELTLSEPFELLAEPLTAANAGGSRSTVRRTSGRRGDMESEGSVVLAWAAFTLRFANATRPPQVETTPLPLQPSVGTGRADDATRRAVEGWVAALRMRPGQPGVRRGRGDQTPAARTISLQAATRIGQGDDGSEATPEIGFDWPEDLHLAGWLELRSGDRLAAAVHPIFGSPATGAPLPALTTVFPVADDEMLVVRYRPDERVGSADGSGPFAFVSAPFEVRFATKSAAAELVWLDRASAAEERPAP